MLSFKEVQLATELRSHCDEHGKEIDPTKTANLLYKLALAYMNKLTDQNQLSVSNFCKIISYEQKLVFIQTATLLCAARVRNATEFSEEEIENKLNELCFYLLETSNAKMSNFNLVEFGKLLKNKIEKWREEVKIKLNEIEIIPDDETDQNIDARIQLERKKVNDIEKLQTQISDTYKQLMAEISHCCIKVMGTPPCKFSLVGMGSLARNEITPYSDFENIIILEEGVQDDEENYQSIVEYFRWFAVLFQTILITLDETILPCVCIPCLNDYETPEGSWFYDAYSGNGISFDGMKPHACKSPLGRQQLTKNKDWTTELIKPISEMVRYLDKDEDIKNGYHLADILTNTCFVDGDQFIYDSFANNVQIILENPKNCDESVIFAQIKEDMEAFNTKLRVSSLIESNSFNIKQCFYRSTTIFISGLGRLYKIKPGSCFGVLREMLVKNLITEEFKNKLMYAVAIACEIRLKMYMKKGRQDDYIVANQRSSINDETKLVTSVLTDLIGQQSCFDYLEIAHCLQYDAIAILNLGSSFMYFHPVSMTICISYILNNFKRIVSMKSFLESVPIFYENRYLGIDSWDFSIGSYHERVEEFKEVMLNKSCNYSNPSNYDKTNDTNVESYGNMSNIFAFLGEYFLKNKAYSEAIDMYKVTLFLLSKSEIKSQKKVIAADIYYSMADCYRKMKKFETALEYFSRAQNEYEIIKKIKEEFFDTNYFIEDCLKGKGLCALKLDRYNEAISLLENSLLLFKNSNEDKNTEIADCIFQLSLCYKLSEQYELALDKLSELHHFCAEHLSIRYAERYNAIAYNHKGYCLKQLENYQEAKKCLVAAIDQYNSLAQYETVYENNKKRICDCHYHLSACIFELREYSEAIKCSRVCIEICKELLVKKKSSKFCEFVGSSYERIGFCYMRKEDYVKAIQNFSEALEFVPTSSYYKAGKINKRLGELYFKIKQPEQALNCYEQALKVAKLKSNDETVDLTVANLLEKCSKCLFFCNKQSKTPEKVQKAKIYFEQCTAIYMKRAEVEPEESMKCFKEIGFIHMKREEYEKAVDWFKRCEQLLCCDVAIAKPSQNQKQNVSISNENTFYCNEEQSERKNIIEFDSERKSFFCSNQSPNYQFDETIAKEKLFCKSPKSPSGKPSNSSNLSSDAQINLAFALKNIAICYDRQEMPDDAIAYFDKFLKFYDRFPCCELRDVAFVYKKLGILHQTKRNFEEAIEHFSKFLEIFCCKRYSPSRNDEEAFVLKKIGLCYQKLKRKNLANEYLRKAKFAYQHLQPRAMYKNDIEFISSMLRKY